MTPTLAQVGSDINFSCNSSASNPKTEIIWYKKDYLVIRVADMTHRFVSAENGQETQAELKMKATHKLNGTVVQCVALWLNQKVRRQQKTIFIVENLSGRLELESTEHPVVTVKKSTKNSHQEFNESISVVDISILSLLALSLVFFQIIFFKWLYNAQKRKRLQNLENRI